MMPGFVVSEEGFEALAALGQDWRNDWSEFDGRALRRQLDAWCEEAKKDEPNWASWKAIYVREDY